MQFLLDVCVCEVKLLSFSTSIMQVYGESSKSNFNLFMVIGQVLISF